jgi:hypothetical protein
LADQELDKARNALAALARTQAARGLADLFLERKRPFEHDPQLKALIDEGLLTPNAFIQKAPRLIRFYRRLLFSLAETPRAILEIGVKGGGSTAFWKALFPAATVVGMDLKLKWGLDAPSDDGVIYVQGDQTDTAALAEIAKRHGPFDVVIDDGSHVVEHQVITLRALLPHVRHGGVYVIEDINTGLKEAGTAAAVDYGDDVWGDFPAGVIQQLWNGPALTATPGGALAHDLVPLIDDLIVGHRVLALRVRERD